MYNDEDINGTGAATEESTDNELSRADNDSENTADNSSSAQENTTDTPTEEKPSEENGNEFSEDSINDSAEHSFVSVAPKGDCEDNGNYLNFGGKDIPEGLNFADTLSFLSDELKYDGNELRQARQKKDGSAIVSSTSGAIEVCSYCGLPITGIDYYRLPDGRKRCTNCNRSLVKSTEELKSIFNEVLLNMELFFGAVIDVPINVEMLEERKLKRKVVKGLGNPPKNILILGVAVEHKGKYTVYIENGIPRASLIATLAHELTHIWQYTHWSVKTIKRKYGKKLRLPIYEGMAMWTEIQYLYHIGEQGIAKRNQIVTSLRPDAYGIGFLIYSHQYPLSADTKGIIEAPFSKGDSPLEQPIVMP